MPPSQDARLFAFVKLRRADSAGELARRQLDTCRRRRAEPERDLRELAAEVVRVDLVPLPASAHLQLVTTEQPRGVVVQLVGIGVTALVLEPDATGLGGVAGDGIDDAEGGVVENAAE